jgi:hypothetical protein
MNRTVIILGGLCIFSQIIAQNSLDDLNVIIKHDFEKNTLGTYNYSEWLEDWSNPTWNCRLAETKIVQDENNPVNSSKTLQWNYPAGSLSPDEGGGQWFYAIPKTDEIYVSYDFMFMPGFEFQLGGKLPSVQGGSLNGLNRPNGYDGFTGGMMFGKNGLLRFYIYYPDGMLDEGGTSFNWGSDPSVNYAYTTTQARIENGTGVAVLAIPGQWHNITYRMVLNSIKSAGAGNYDGILEAYYDGKLVTQVSHILFRHTTDLKIDVMRMYTFFGGGDDSWRNPIDEWLKVDNVMLYTFKEGINVPRGNVLSPADRTINYWRNFNNDDNPPPVVEEPPVPVIEEPPVPVIEEPTVINNSPIIDNQEFMIKEATFSDNFIGKVIAKDADLSQKLDYSIISGNESGSYKINALSGELTAVGNSLFGPDTITQYLEVEVSDNAPEPKSATASIKITLIGKSIEKGEEVTFEPVMTLYPNPSPGQINILVEGIFEESADTQISWSELQVIDILGKTIYSKRINIIESSYRDMIDLTGISVGFYFVVLKMATKIIKEKLIIKD